MNSEAVTAAIPPAERARVTAIGNNALAVEAVRRARASTQGLNRSMWTCVISSAAHSLRKSSTGSMLPGNALHKLRFAPPRTVATARSHAVRAAADILSSARDKLWRAEVSICEAAEGRLPESKALLRAQAF